MGSQAGSWVSGCTVRGARCGVRSAGRTVRGSWVRAVEVARCGVVAGHGAGKFARVGRSGTVRRRDEPAPRDEPCTARRTLHRTTNPARCGSVVASWGLARSCTVGGSWAGAVEAARCGVVAGHGAGKFARVGRSGTVRFRCSAAGARTGSGNAHGVSGTARCAGATNLHRTTNPAPCDGRCRVSRSRPAGDRRAGRRGRPGSRRGGRRRRPSGTTGRRARRLRRRARRRRRPGSRRRGSGRRRG